MMASCTTLYKIEEPIDVMLGDERTLTPTGRGEVTVRPNGESKSCVM